MTLGLTIPGVETVHPREEWEPFCQPYTVASQNPPLQRMSDITQPVAHYTGADDLIDGDPGEHASDLAAFIANMQYSYATRRGYSIGYLFTIDWLGGVWEQRGFDYESAANLDHNGYTAPFLYLVDGNDPVTPEAAASGRAVWREFRRRSARADFKTRPLGHGELYLTTGEGTPTPCPGTGILNQLHTGVLDLDNPEDNTVKYFRITGDDAVWYTPDGVIAVRVDADHIQSREPRPTIHTVAEHDAVDFLFVDTVNRGVVL